MRKTITTYRLAAILGLGYHQLTHALKQGYLRVSHQAGPRHYWSDAEIRLCCDYFGLPYPDFVQNEHRVEQGVHT